MIRDGRAETTASGAYDLNGAELQELRASRTPLIRPYAGSCRAVKEADKKPNVIGHPAIDDRGAMCSARMERYTAFSPLAYHQTQMPSSCHE
jgi:hypothetical protein